VETLLCRTTAASTPNITQAHIAAAVRRACTDLGVGHQVLNNKNTGSYSLQFGCAMALKLNGADMSTIMEQGQWMSLAFLTYIRNQISQLSISNSTMMSNPIPFSNLLGI
jgi:hypothetical protein